MIIKGQAEFNSGVNIQTSGENAGTIYLTL